MKIITKKLHIKKLRKKNQIQLFMILMMIFFQLNWAPDLSRSNHAFNLSCIFSASYARGKNSYHSHILAPCIVSGNRLVIPSRGWESGATLKQGKELKSCNGKFHLKMQTDGNLVLYKNTHHDHHVDNTKSVIWSSETNGKGPNAKLVMQDDNNLVLYRYNRERGPDYIAMWSTDTQGVGINYASDGVRIKSAGRQFNIHF